MIQPLSLVLCVAILTIGLWVLFSIRNSHIRRSHKGRIKNMKLALDLHKRQIGLRNENLSRYDFLKYNLAEVMVPQADLNI